MPYSSFLDFALKYNGKKLVNNAYFGFDITALDGFYHVHCKTFNAYRGDIDNRTLSDIVVLYDVNGNITVKVALDHVTGVTACNENYWDVYDQLYLKGWD